MLSYTRTWSWWAAIFYTDSSFLKSGKRIGWWLAELLFVFWEVFSAERNACLADQSPNILQILPISILAKHILLFSITRLLVPAISTRTLICIFIYCIHLSNIFVQYKWHTFSFVWILLGLCPLWCMQMALESHSLGFSAWCLTLRQGFYPRIVLGWRDSHPLAFFVHCWLAATNKDLNVVRRRLWCSIFHTCTRICTSNHTC